MKKLFVSAFAVFACLLSFNLSAAECTGFSLEWSGLTHYQLNSFYLADEEDYDPNLWMQFYQDEETGKITAGTYDLGSTINSTYKTCTECVYLQSDLVGEGEDAKYSKVYYQKSGTLTIEAVDASNEIKGTIQAVLAEATIADDLTTTFVTDGGCIEIETATFDSGVCVPDCTGKICGDDGCGGTCGEGCGDLACSEDQKSCVEYECTKITLNNDPVFDGSYIEYGSYSYQFNHTPVAFEGDYTTFELYDAIEAGSYDLAGTNYADCDVCMQLFEDIQYDEEGYMTGIGKRFFQKSGTVTVNSFNETTGAIDAALNNVRLVEVTVDSDWNSTEVAGGKCYDITNTPFAYGDDTGSDPADTGDTGSDPADTGDTGNNDPADTGDTEVPGDDTSDTGSAPSDGDTDTTPADGDDTTPTDGDDTNSDKGGDDGGCALVTL